MPKLTTKDITEFKNIKKRIYDRIDYVYDQIYRAFGYDEKVIWYFDDDEDMENSISDKNRYISSYIDSPYINDGEFLIYINGEINLFDGFPRRWLFEDFEDELKDGINRQKERIEKLEQKALKKKAKEEQEKIEKIKSIKNKLTKEEHLLLGLG
jgi:hypothetical protein